jgi:hypothetical protein
MRWRAESELHCAVLGIAPRAGRGTQSRRRCGRGEPSPGADVGRPAPRAGRGTSRPSRASRGTAWRSCPSSSRSAADTATSAPRPPVARICAATCLPDARDDEAVVRTAAHDHDRAVPARAAAAQCRVGTHGLQHRRVTRACTRAAATTGGSVRTRRWRQACWCSSRHARTHTYCSRSVRLTRAWMARTTTAAQRSAACSKHAHNALCAGSAAGRGWAALGHTAARGAWTRRCPRSRRS